MAQKMAGSSKLAFWGGAAVNLALRAGMAYFLAETVLNPFDPRFAGKAIPERNLVIIGLMSIFFPVLYFLRKVRPYPVWLDNLYLSVFALDMAGNSFNLYNTYEHFDLLPHLWGTGAFAYVFAWLLGKKAGVQQELAAWAGFGLANAGHVLLEAQEYYTDVFAGTINVGGVGDTINDLLVGLLGAFVSALLFIAASRMAKKNSGQIKNKKYKKSALILGGVI